MLLPVSIRFLSIFTQFLFINKPLGLTVLTTLYLSRTINSAWPATTLTWVDLSKKRELRDVFGASSSITSRNSTSIVQTWYLTRSQLNSGTSLSSSTPNATIGTKKQEESASSGEPTTLNQRQIKTSSIGQKGSTKDISRPRKSFCKNSSQPVDVTADIFTGALTPLAFSSLARFVNTHTAQYTPGDNVQQRGGQCQSRDRARTCSRVKGTALAPS